jgi:predicted nucleic acid-binding protein
MSRPRIVIDTNVLISAAIQAARLTRPTESLEAASAYSTAPVL